MSLRAGGCCPVIPASALLCDARTLSLGCGTLDALLGGGLPVSCITEIAGESSAGKTQWAMLLAVRVSDLVHPPARVPAWLTYFLRPS